MRGKKEHYEGLLPIFIVHDEFRLKLSEQQLKLFLRLIFKSYHLAYVKILNAFVPNCDIVVNGSQFTQMFIARDGTCHFIFFLGDCDGDYSVGYEWFFSFRNRRANLDLSRIRGLAHRFCIF